MNQLSYKQWGLWNHQPENVWISSRSRTTKKAVFMPSGDEVRGGVTTMGPCVSAQAQQRNKRNAGGASELLVVNNHS
jgi:hypothetical protein